MFDFAELTVDQLVTTGRLNCDLIRVTRLLRKRQTQLDFFTKVRPVLLNVPDGAGLDDVQLEPDQFGE